MAQRSEAGILQAHGFFHQFLDGAAFHMPIQAGLVAHLATQQLVDWDVEEFSLDIPRCDVDRRHRTGNGATSKMIGTQHYIPMVLDRERVTADQIFAVLGDRGGRGLQCPQVPDSPRPIMPASVWTRTYRKRSSSSGSTLVIFMARPPLSVSGTVCRPRVPTQPPVKGRNLHVKGDPSNACPRTVWAGWAGAAAAGRDQGGSDHPPRATGAGAVRRRQIGSSWRDPHARRCGNG